MGGFGRRLLVAMVLLCLIAPVFASNGRTAGAARQRNVDAPPPVDVTAIALRPNDLDRDGFMMRGGSMLSPQDLAVQTGVSVDEVMESGLGRSYSMAISLAPDGRSDCMGQVIVSWVYELADEDSARDMLDESILISTDDEWDVLEEDVEIGDGGVIFDSPAPPCFADEPNGLRRLAQGADDLMCTDMLTREEVECGDGIEVAFTIENLMVHVWLSNNVDPDRVPSDAYDIDEETVLALGRIAEEKAEAALDGELGPGLQPAVLRLGDGEIFYGNSVDDYLRLDGIDFAFDDETDDEFEERISYYGDATDIYQLVQPFDNEDGELNVLVNTHYRFEDEDVASEWLAGVEERLVDSTHYADFEEVELDEEYGDESYAFSYLDTGKETEHVRVFARFGTLVVSFNVGMESGMSDEILVTLMDEQVECLEEGFCASPVSFPAR